MSLSFLFYMYPDFVIGLYHTMRYLYEMFILYLQCTGFFLLSESTQSDVSKLFKEKQVNSVVCIGTGQSNFVI